MSHIHNETRPQVHRSWSLCRRVHFLRLSWNWSQNSKGQVSSRILRPGFCLKLYSQLAQVRNEATYDARRMALNRVFHWWLKNPMVLKSVNMYDTMSNAQVSAFFHLKFCAIYWLMCRLMYILTTDLNSIAGVISLIGSGRIVYVGSSVINTLFITRGINFSPFVSTERKKKIPHFCLLVVVLKRLLFLRRQKLLVSGCICQDWIRTC